jgi:hypothetical protein
MKKIWFSLLVVLATTVVAQDRIDEKPTSLTYKSKEIRYALFWERNPKKGKWESRINTDRPYYGEGKFSSNFNSIFFGKIDSLTFLFIDYWDGRFKYPNLKLEWTYYKSLKSALITDSDYEAMKNIQYGETLKIFSKFTDYAFKGDVGYSFSVFLDDIKRSYSSFIKDIEQGYELYLTSLIMTIKRVKSEGKDVVRFRVYPDANYKLIDSCYFEIPYNDFQVLFKSDSRLRYK